jgi:hypothetical protein
MLRVPCAASALGEARNNLTEAKMSGQFIGTNWYITPKLQGANFSVMQVFTDKNQKKLYLI